MQEEMGVKPRTLKVSPWDNPSARKSRYVWAMADKLYEVVEVNKGIGAARLGKNFGLTEASLVHLNKKLKTGWNPSVDEDWLAFKQQYKQQEAPIAA